jgi:rhomboid protease GluP
MLFFRSYTTTMPTRAKFPFISIMLVLISLLTWFVMAHRLHLNLFQSQKSWLLMQVGAANGVALERGELWRLITSQFLHVHFLHMLGNMFGIYLLASAIEKTSGHAWLAFIYLIGGSIGQYCSVLFRPELVSSGASQALMALCGFTLFSYRQFTQYGYAVKVSAAIVLLQIALDVYVSASIKVGHSVGFIAGIAFAIIFKYANSARPA